MIFMYKITYGLVDNKIKDFLNLSNETRTRAAIDLSFLSSTVRMIVFIFSFFPRTARDWNQLLPDMRLISK